MSNLGDRIRVSLERKKISQAQLARQTGVKQQTISYLCAKDCPATTTRYATKIAEVLGVNPHWLQTGEGDPYNPSVTVDCNGAPVTIHRVPLFDCLEDAHVFAMGDGLSDSQPRMLTDIEVGERAFAISANDQSMTPQIKTGDRIVIDPSTQPQPGDIVLAHTALGIVLRKYRMRGYGVFELLPNNNDWPPMLSDKEEIEVIGVMVEHRTYRPKS